MLEQSASLSLIFHVYQMSTLMPHNGVEHVKSDGIWTEELVFVPKKT